MTIKQQFFILIAIVTLAMMTQIGLNRYHSTALIQLEQDSVLLAQVETGMLLLRRNDKDFLMRKDLKYVEKFEKNHQVLLTRIQQLNDMLLASDIDNEHARKIGQILTEYADKFRALVSVQQEIGLHHKDGLYGSLRKAVHGVEKIVKEQQEYHLLSDMLMLRRNEKDFMLRDDLKYTEKYKKNITKFEQMLAVTSIPSDVRAEITKALSTYQKDFFCPCGRLQSQGAKPKRGATRRDALHCSSNG
ncbi:MAG: hypothetical protein N0C88_07655 [Candidatus Thiodiazotropha lotti]|uniref:HBM domain-containing protein n=1 Tax=Candidatus Thiodiazotropha lotti TaxID=2792787 RepID=A0A9E4K4K0_9GAMM|nr:hypothetical protein [Candidatus Thiodiazotropha lotti]MCW4203186.1 hypothetical protein [Candidatus Thiodiazotropha lotti]